MVNVFGKITPGNTPLEEILAEPVAHKPLVLPRTHPASPQARTCHKACANVGDQTRRGS
jgi:hypothetical protein